MDSNRLNVHVTGLRGIPDVQGGVERHCENLYPRLLGHGVDPVLYARSVYVSNKTFSYRGVKVVPFKSIPHSSLEAVSHTCLSVFRAARAKARILHIHAIGPALWTPLAKRLGMKVVVTHHGFDYRRQKWGANAKAVLRKGEVMAIRHADAIICISQEIVDAITSQNPVGLVAKIPNGVIIPSEIPDPEPLAKWGLHSGKYLLLTARFVQEKGIIDLINAWDRSGLKERCGLAVAGGEDHPSALGDEIRCLAAKTGAVLPGVLSGNDLACIYGHARGFVLPSSHEGLPISLLEAMSWRLPVVASSIQANLEVGLDPDAYFPHGNIEALAARLAELCAGPGRVDHSHRMKAYNWDTIADSTNQVYRRVINAESGLEAFSSNTGYGGEILKQGK